LTFQFVTEYAIMATYEIGRKSNIGTVYEKFREKDIE
jgi:hypothetical protein